MSQSTPSRSKSEAKRQRDFNNRRKNWHDNRQVNDIHVPWFYETHSIILLSVVLSIIGYCTFRQTVIYPQTSHPETLNQIIQSGLWEGGKFAVLTFLAVGGLVFPAGN